jgi:anti-sigma B factor antagonist
MEMNAEEVGMDLVITVKEPRIDAAVAVVFKQKMAEMTDHPAKRVVLDLSAVDFLDSSGLGAVVGAMKSMGEGRKLDLAGLSPTVQKVFRLTRMDTVFRIYPSRQAALMDVAHAS